jgi:shikimate kinase
MTSGQTSGTRQGNNVVLVGFRCSGKNTIGESLARRLGWPMLDMDQRIQEICGQNIAALVERSGWESFRQLEARVVEEIKPQEQRVIITGGGVIENPENVQHLRRAGTIVFLEAGINDILKRMAADKSTPATRPGLTGLPVAEEVRIVLERREPLYRSAADLVVNTSSYSVERCVDLIVQFLSSKGAANTSQRD